MFKKEKDKKGTTKGDKKKKKESSEEADSLSSIADKTPPPEPASPQGDKTREEEEKRKREEQQRRIEFEKKKAEEEKRKAEKAEKKKLMEQEKAASKEKKKHEKEREREKPERIDVENVEAEIASLENIRPDAHESPSLYKELYNLLPKEVFISYDKLQNFARDLNTQIPTPEIVILGKKGDGKSSLIESFFGEPLNAVGYGGITKRPFYLNMINNLECEEPKCTLKRDTVLKEFDHDIEVKLSDLSSEIHQRNKIASDEPIILQYEWRNCCNMTFIDTPGLFEHDDGEVSKEEREQLVLSLAKPVHRIILCVEACRDWSRMEMVNFVKKVDPELSRTTFVYTKFQSHLQNFTATREVNKFLSGALPDVKTFFVTVPSEGVRARFNEADTFQKKMYQSYRRDMNLLEQLQFDKRYEAMIGVHSLRKYVLNLTWKSYQESIPRILKQLRAKKTTTQRKVDELTKQLDHLDSSQLRSIASNYVVNFLQSIERLIAGTSEGNPAVNGQTLEEEKNAHGDGDWVDLYNRVIRFEPEEWNIPYWDNKLYGGQQFERLLAEYKAVAEHTDISEVTMDDVATAAGINKLNNIPNYSWAASDLAQQKSQDAFAPLIEQLTNRAVFIMKRLTDITEKVLESKKKKWMEDFRDGSLDDFEHYPYFTYHVKDLYFKYVDQVSKECKEKCMDEFYNTRTIYWDLTSEYADRNLPLERNDQEDTKTAVVNLSTDIFNQLRERITKNVLLKFYNFFLVPMQSELWNEIQGKVNCLSDSALEQIFEVSNTKEKLKQRIDELHSELNHVAEQDKLFMEYAGVFSKRVEDH